MKTYVSIIYFNSGIKNRINAGLIMFNEERCLIDIKDSRLSFVKLFKPSAFNLFKDTLLAYRNHYRRHKATFDEIEKLFKSQNGILQFDAPKKIQIELNKENFYKYFELI